MVSGAPRGPERTAEPRRRAASAGLKHLPVPVQVENPLPEVSCSSDERECPATSESEPPVRGVLTTPTGYGLEGGTVDGGTFTSGVD
jgi:hypothetical protein